MRVLIFYKSTIPTSRNVRMFDWRVAEEYEIRCRTKARHIHRMLQKGGGFLIFRTKRRMKTKQD